MTEIKCPTCGSADSKKSGWRILSGYRKVQTWQCKRCGRLFRELDEILMDAQPKESGSQNITEFFK